MTVPEVKEIRYYKGKWKVQIVKKSRMNYLVQSLEFIPSKATKKMPRTAMCIGVKFTTVPRLLWRNPRK